MAQKGAQSRNTKGLKTVGAAQDEGSFTRMASQPCVGQEKIFSINTRDPSASKYDDAANAYAQTFASPSPTHSATQSPR